MRALATVRWLLLSSLSLVLVFALPARAQWTENGAPVCTATGNQTLLRVIPDGNGGVILVWKDQRSASDIYAQRLDSDGIPLWTPDGVPVGTGNCDRPELVSDGLGGAIVVWEDLLSSPRAIYAQHLDASSGARQWPTNGVLLSTPAGLAFLPRVVSDGANGAIVAWLDGRAPHFG